MRLNWLSAFLLIALGSIDANAQSLQIHGHPQKSAYNDPSEFIPIEPQCHWDPSNRKAQLFDMMGHPLANPSLGHSHFLLWTPIYAEVNHAISMNFTLKMYLDEGYIDQVTSELGYFIWDATNDWHTPHMNGDPMTLVQFTGKFILDPARAQQDDSGSWYGPVSFNPHGWTRIQISYRLTLLNGAVNRYSFTFPVYSTLHPEIPELAVPADFAKQLRSDCLPYSPKGGNTFGSSIVEFRDYIPIAPLQANQVWSVPVFVYTYGQDGPEPPGTFSEHLDPDLHNGNPGRLLTTNSNNILFDANVIGTGIHKVSLAWDVKKADTQEESVSILQFPIAVVGGTTPPPTCQDPLALNVGGPLPCIYPPPPPVPMWQEVPSKTFRLLDQIKTCMVSDNKCTDPVLVK